MYKKFRRFRSLILVRGIHWALTSLSSETRVIPFFANFANNLLNSKILRTVLLELGGSNSDQLWNERSVIFNEVISNYVNSIDKDELEGVKILEIGSWSGAGSTRLFRALIEKRGLLVQIDKWSKDYAGTHKHVSNTAKLMSKNVLNAQILNSINNESLGTEVSRRIITIRSTTRSLSTLMNFEPVFDVIYIDGSHIYEDVKQDLNFALKALKKDALLCGDDLEFGVDPKYLALALNSIDRDLILLDDGQAFHPGVYLTLLESGLKINHENGFWWTINQ